MDLATETRRARVFIVDDHPAMREALASRIGRQPDLEVCGEAPDINEALDGTSEAHPDVVVVDITLKSGSGLDLIKRLKNRDPAVRVLVCSMHSESLYADRALRAGALGYINKDQATDKIIEAIRQVLEGKVYLSSSMTEKMLQRSVGGETIYEIPRPEEVLADRELQVFHLIGQGVKTTEIAERLHLGLKTIETYRVRIKEKLSIKSSTDLAFYATRWMMEELDDKS